MPRFVKDPWRRLHLLLWAASLVAGALFYLNLEAAWYFFSGRGLLFEMFPRGLILPGWVTADLTCITTALVLLVFLSPAIRLPRLWAVASAGTPTRLYLPRFEGELMLYGLAGTLIGIIIAVPGQLDAADPQSLLSQTRALVGGSLTALYSTLAALAAVLISRKLEARWAEVVPPPPAPAGPLPGDMQQYMVHMVAILQCLATALRLFQDSASEIKQGHDRLADENKELRKAILSLCDLVAEFGVQLREGLTLRPDALEPLNALPRLVERMLVQMEEQQIRARAYDHGLLVTAGNLQSQQEAGSGSGGNGAERRIRKEAVHG